MLTVSIPPQRFKNLNFVFQHTQCTCLVHYLEKCKKVIMRAQRNLLSQSIENIERYKNSDEWLYIGHESNVL